VVLHPRDTVATTLVELEPGQPVSLRDQAGNPGATVRARTPVPVYHKIALRDHAQGDPVLKYGESIGVATRPIHTGEHVHTHNLESPRGGARGAAGL
jgi:hypothetical protein